MGIYMEYALKLIDSKKAYYCFCTKERLDSLKGKNDEGIEFSKYDRHCLYLSEKETEENLKAGIPFVIRQKMPESGKTTFTDAVYGEITVENSELDDQILIKSDGFPTYNFANVVDDHLMNITHVVRGSEYLSSTPKYTLLYEAFGWDTPEYVHLPPVMRDAQHKLSKRQGDKSFEDLIADGYIPEAIINYIALLGWSPGDNTEIFSLDELIKVFKISGLSKSPAIFDIKKLAWMNGEYFKGMSGEAFSEHSKDIHSGTIKSGLDIQKIAELLKTRIETLNQIPELTDFFDELPEYDNSLYEHKKMKTNSENSLDSLKACLPVFEGINEWRLDVIHDSIMSLIEDMGIKNGQMLWPIRTALSGKPSSPGGAFELAEILGKEETIKRIEKGIEKLSL